MNFSPCLLRQPIQIPDMLFVMMCSSNGVYFIRRQLAQVPLQRASHFGGTRIDRDAVIDNGPELLSEDKRNHIRRKTAQEKQFQPAIEKVNPCAESGKMPCDAHGGLTNRGG